MEKEGNTDGQEVREGDPPGVTQDSENPAEVYQKENCLMGSQELWNILRGALDVHATKASLNTLSKTDDG